MFDVITYDKGGSVLRMIERHLGDDTFRRGLNLYLDKHRYSNTDHDGPVGRRSKSPPASRCGRRWAPGSTSPATPWCRSSSRWRDGPELSQRRFLLDGGSDEGASWVVPVSLRYQTSDGVGPPPSSYCSRASPRR